jgi:hypothetical protein
MAFTGNPTVTRVGRFIARLTGVVIGAGAQGTIGFIGDVSADVALPRDFPDGTARGLPLSSIVEVHVEAVAPGAAMHHVQVIKNDGPPFRITLLNDDADVANLEVYVHYWS